MTRQLIPFLPVLDFRALTDAQLATAETIFNEFRDLELQPAYLADADPNRALLDRRVVCDLLGFDDATYQAVRPPRPNVVRRAIRPRRQGPPPIRQVRGVAPLIPEPVEESSRPRPLQSHAPRSSLPRTPVDPAPALPYHPGQFDSN